MSSHERPDDEQAAAERTRLVTIALHSLALENLFPDDETIADMCSWSAGCLTSEQVIQRTRARYGLDPQPESPRMPDA